MHFMHMFWLTLSNGAVLSVGKVNGKMDEKIDSNVNENLVSHWEFHSNKADLYWITTLDVVNMYRWEDGGCKSGAQIALNPVDLYTSGTCTRQIAQETQPPTSNWNGQPLIMSTTSVSSQPTEANNGWVMIIKWQN